MIFIVHVVLDSFKIKKAKSDTLGKVVVVVVVPTRGLINDP